MPAALGGQPRGVGRDAAPDDAGGPRRALAATRSCIAVAGVIPRGWHRHLMATSLVLLLAAPAMGEEPPAIRLRVGDHPGYGRLVFDGPDGTAPAYHLVRTGDHVSLRFIDPTSLDLAAAARPPRNLAGLREAEGAVAIVLRTAEVRVRHFVLGNRIVVDLLDPPRPATEPVNRRDQPAQPDGRSAVRPDPGTLADAPDARGPAAGRTGAPVRGGQVAASAESRPALAVRLSPTATRDANPVQGFLRQTAAEAAAAAPRGAPPRPRQTARRPSATPPAASPAATSPGSASGQPGTATAALHPPPPTRH
jgi:hypothetical protein